MESRREKFDKALVRVGIVLPLTLWLPLIWMQSSSIQQMASQCYFAANMLSIAGIVLILFAKVDPIAKQGIAIGIMINYVLLFEQICK